MSEREADERPSHGLETRQTFEETITAGIRQLLIGREVFRTEFLAEKEKFAALEKRLKCLREAVASTDAEVAAWVDKSTSSMEELEYWDAKMSSLRDGQENIQYQSVTIDLLAGLIASTKEKLAAQWEIKTSLMGKHASFRETEEELKREMSRAKAMFTALKLVSEKVYQLEEELIKALKPNAGDAQPSTTGHD
jgi:chromosome segregation ATPase